MRLFIMVAFLGIFFFVGCKEEDEVAKNYCSKSCEHQMNCDEYFFEDYKSLSECKDECNIFLPAELEYSYYKSDDCGSAYEKMLKCFSEKVNVKECGVEENACSVEYTLYYAFCDEGDED